MIIKYLTRMKKSKSKGEMERERERGRKGRRREGEGGVDGGRCEGGNQIFF